MRRNITLAQPRLYETGVRHVGYDRRVGRAPANFGRRWLSRLFRLETWNIGIIERSRVNLEELISTGRLPEVQWCSQKSATRFRADPFLWREAGELRLIFEEYSRWRGRADIRSLTLRDALRGEKGRKELATPIHLSYPQLVRNGADTYCVPESAEGGGVDLYLWDVGARCWRHRSRVLDECVLDPTLVQIDGLWYMFGTLMGDRSEALRIWWSHDLLGPWEQHALNSSASLLGTGRSAGPIFTSGGQWYRPVQDNSRGYGSALFLHRIDRLSPDFYGETRLSKILPDPDGPFPAGLHTLMIDEEFVVIDGKHMGWSLMAPLFKAIWIISHKRRCASLEPDITQASTVYTPPALPTQHR